MKQWTRRLCQSTLMLLCVAAVIQAPVEAAGLPDLKVSSVMKPAAADAGTVVNVVTTVANSGTGDAGASFLKLYLSTDNVLNATDIEIGGRSVPALLVKWR